MTAWWRMWTELCARAVNGQGVHDGSASSLSSTLHTPSLQQPHFLSCLVTRNITKANSSKFSDLLQIASLLTALDFAFHLFQYSSIFRLTRSKVIFLVISKFSFLHCTERVPPLYPAEMWDSTVPSSTGVPRILFLIWISAPSPCFPVIHSYGFLMKSI